MGVLVGLIETFSYFYGKKERKKTPMDSKMALLEYKE
jgi:hypothetical protein